MAQEEWLIPALSQVESIDKKLEEKTTEFEVLLKFKVGLCLSVYVYEIKRCHYSDDVPRLFLV